MNTGFFMLQRRMVDIRFWMLDSSAIAEASIFAEATTDKSEGRQGFV